MTYEEYESCPYCDEDILVTALKCKHCLSLLYDPESIEAIEQKGQSGLMQSSPDVAASSDKNRLFAEPAVCSGCGYKLKPQANYCTFCGEAVR